MRAYSSFQLLTQEPYLQYLCEDWQYFFMTSWIQTFVTDRILTSRVRAFVARYGVRRLLWIGFGILLFFHFISLIPALLGGAPIYWFYMDSEFNVPTLVSTLLWLAVGYQLAYGYRSYLIAALAITLGIDEWAGIHEIVEELIKQNLGDAVWWYVPIAAGAFAVMIYTLKQSASVLQNYKFFFGLLVFFVGAIGMDILIGWFVTSTGLDINGPMIEPLRLTYVVLSTIEESLEIIGLIIMLISILPHKKTAPNLS